MKQAPNSTSRSEGHITSKFEVPIKNVWVCANVWVCVNVWVL